MREIIFKAKRKDNEEWVEGWLLGNPNSKGGVFIVTYYQYVLEPKKGEKYIIAPKSLTYFEVIPETVCEYVGITNSKNVKAFEDDKVEMLGSIYQIEWDYHTCGFYLSSSDGGEDDSINALLNNDFEVIGNIHNQEVGR